MILMGGIALTAGLMLDLDKAAELVNFGACAGFMVVNLSVISHYFVRKKRTRTARHLELSFGAGRRLCRVPLDLAERFAAGYESGSDLESGRHSVFVSAGSPARNKSADHARD